jgi:hypothetical protein
MYIQIFYKYKLQRVFLVKSNMCVIQNGTKVKAQATSNPIFI